MMPTTRTLWDAVDAVGKACSWGDAGSHSGKQTALHTMKRMLGWPVLSSWRGGLSICIILLFLKSCFNALILTFFVSITTKLIIVNSHLAICKVYPVQIVIIVNLFSLREIRRLPLILISSPSGKTGNSCNSC